MSGYRRTIWDFWATRYEGLWAQHFSLEPSRRLVRDRIDEVAPRATRFLDLGCGVGQFAWELACRRPGITVVAADSSRLMIDRALADYAHPAVTYLHGGIEVVDSAEGFDVVTCMHAFPYLPDPVAVLRRIHALTRPGGHVMIVQANTENAYDWGFLKFVKLTTTAAEYRSTRELGDLFELSGFRRGIVRTLARPVFIPTIALVEGVK